MLAVLTPVSYGAKHRERLQWKSFDASCGCDFEFSFPELTVSIRQQTPSSSTSFREDNLCMIVRRRDGRVMKQDFISSYGEGRLLLKGGYLFLEYGIGRGTGVREEHIKAYAPFADDATVDPLVEVFDFQKSYRVFSPSYAGTNLIEYKVKVIEDKESVRVILHGVKKGFGLPERKEILLKKLVNQGFQGIATGSR